MPYWKREDSPYFYGRVWDARAQAWTKDRSLKVRDEFAADRACREWERRLADPGHAAATTFTLKDTLAGLGKHLASRHLRGDASPRTLDYHQGKIGPLLRLFGEDALVSQITPALIEKYRAARHAEGSSDHNTVKELRVLKYALRIAKLDGKFSGELDAIFPRMEARYKPYDRVLSHDEVDAFLGLASEDVGAMIAFSVATGAEVKCIETARREDVGDKFVLLRGTKRPSRWRRVPLLGLCRPLIAFTMRNAQGKDGKLFAGNKWGLKSALDRISLKLEVPHVCPNDLRRTFATMVREAGAPIELIAPLMGHADTTMVQRVYARLSPEALSERLYVALNAGAACSEYGSQPPANSRTGTHAVLEFPRKMEPTAGFEPATYGLRNQRAGGISLRIPPECVYVA